MLSLWFASGEDSLSVRHFSVREALSSLFEVDVVAHSPDDDIELESLVGRPASFRIARGLAQGSVAARTFVGVCSAARQTRVEPNGLSIYELRLVPALWLLTQRRNHRVFQHVSVPEIAEKLLGEWGIGAAWNIDRAAYPKLEYRVQYGESDFSFVSRLLEETGISYTIGGESEGAGLALFDAIESTEPRVGGPIPYEDSPHGAGQREYVTSVRISHEVRPGRLTLRDFDFRRKPDTPLFASAAADSPHEVRLEQHVYSPGSFFAEGAKGGDTPVGDDRGVSRAQEKVGKEQAERSLASTRTRKRHVELRTNLIDLRPGTVFSIRGHGHGELAPDRTLLMTDLRMSGAHDGEWTIEGTAVFADVPHRPPRTTPKPVVQGVESAIVVGPESEEIHTDEYGRVRVQFHWDREGDFDDGSSCWIRVSQGWAGAGYGMLSLPRVGQEVVVGFFGGDPDQPVIVGRLFNNTSRVPYKLPEHRTKTTWRSSSTPGSDGFNEITFEDAKGRERVLIQAERDLEKLVRMDEWVTIGRHHTRQIGASETVAVGGSHTLSVGANRVVRVGGDDQTTVLGRHAVTVAPAEPRRDGQASTGMELLDRKITLTTGEATITLEGPNITLDAAASILLRAAADITVTGRANIHLAAGASAFIQADDGDVVVRGGPYVHINPAADAEDEAFGEIPVEAPPDVEMDDEVEQAEEEARFRSDDPQWLKTRLAKGGAWDPERWGHEYEGFAYFHLGVISAAAGIPQGVLVRQMGRRSTLDLTEERGDPGNGLFGGKSPYGNEPHQYHMMKKGAAYYARNYLWTGDEDA